MASEKYFIETSIARHAIFGHKAVKGEIRSIIKGKKRSSSYFVFMEYKRSFLCNLIEFYFVVKSSDTLAEALKIWNEKFQIRKIKDITFAMATLLDEGTGNFRQEIALTKLKTLIIDAYLQFLILINDSFVENQIKCLLGKRYLFETGAIPSEKDFKDFYDFFQEDYAEECQIKKYTKKNAKKLAEIVAKAIEGQNFKQIQNVLNSQNSNNCYRCSTIGDSLLTLEIPKGFTVLTFDRGVDSLCKLLNKDVLLLPSASSLMKQPINQTGIQLQPV